ncbi:MAG: CapA family protein [Melioribacteraceae bacterium]|nr:CapA family protein [Melioribacteraceae bacterium]
MNSKYFITFIILAAIVYWLINPFYTLHEIKEPLVNEIEEIIDSTVTVSFSAVGDIMCHSTQYNYAYVSKDSFDFNPMFDVLRNYLSEKDILIGNLETVLAGDTKSYSGYPFFNSPNSLAESLKNTGFDFLTTANNHANDQGFEGVKRTLEELRKINIVPLGTSSLDSNRNYNYFVRKGLRFGMLSYTYGTNYNEKSLNPKMFVNHIDTVKIKTDITELKNKGTEIIIVLFHFGEQYMKNISKYQKQIVEKTINYGADIILGAHPHIVQQFEQFETKNANLDTGFVVYSLGNFVSNQRWRYSDGGVIFNFDITKNIFTDSVYVSKINYLPIWVFKGETNRGKEYIILPSEEFGNITYDYLTEADVDSMKKSYFDTINQLTSKSRFLEVDVFNKME